MISLGGDSVWVAVARRTVGVLKWSPFLNQWERKKGWQFYRW